MSADGESQRCERAIRLGLRWLTSLRQPDGSYPARTLAAHYKSPLLLAETNRLAQGNQTLDWIIQRYMTADGHFDDALADSASNRYCDLYEDLWIAWGATRLGRFEVARVIFDFCTRFYSCEHGGFRSTINETPGIASECYDLRSTALAGLVALGMKETDVAMAAGEFAISLMDQQPNALDEFLLVRDEHGNLVGSFPQHLARVFVIPRAPGQSHTPLYYALGLGIVLLSRLYEATREPRYLVGAERYAAICRNYGEIIFRNHYSGKLGWAFRMLSRLSGKKEYAQMADMALAYLIETQLPTGAWSVPTLYARSEDQPLSFTIDRTAEYTLWITYVESDGAPVPGAPGCQPGPPDAPARQDGRPG